MSVFERPAPAGSAALREQLESIYLSPDQVRREVRERANGQLLKSLSCKEMRTDGAPVIDGSYAVLSRNIATPNFETINFCQLARRLGLAPLILEFGRDIASNTNPGKRALMQLEFDDTSNEVPNTLNRRRAVPRREAKSKYPLSSLVTKWGEPLLTFHAVLFAQHSCSAGVQRIETSNWFEAHGGRATTYYRDFFGLFTGPSVLCESFLLNNHEERFTRDVVIPSFAAAWKHYGRRPLVCRLDPPELEGHSRWLRYPEELLPIVDRAMGLTE